jgi:hypothetical protein
MLEGRTIKNSEYQRAVSLLSKLFEFDSDIEREINTYIQNYGICHFFENLEAFELSADVCTKLKAVRSILFSQDRATSKITEGGEVNGQ